MEVTVTSEECIQEGLVDWEKACEILQIGSTTIYELMKAKELPFVRVRSKRKIPLAAIRKYIAANLVQG